jgi:hypothetical protein
MDALSGYNSAGRTVVNHVPGQPCTYAWYEYLGVFVSA